MNCFCKIKYHANVLVVHCNNATTQNTQNYSNKIMFIGKTAKYNTCEIEGFYSKQRKWMPVLEQREGGGDSVRMEMFLEGRERERVKYNKDDNEDFALRKRQNCHFIEQRLQVTY